MVAMYQIMKKAERKKKKNKRNTIKHNVIIAQ